MTLGQTTPESTESVLHKPDVLAIVGTWPKPS
jgi:hypothetical protein